MILKRELAVVDLQEVIQHVDSLLFITIRTIKDIMKTLLNNLLDSVETKGMKVLTGGETKYCIIQ